MINPYKSGVREMPPIMLQERIELLEEDLEFLHAKMNEERTQSDPKLMEYYQWWSTYCDWALAQCKERLEKYDA